MAFNSKKDKLDELCAYTHTAEKQLRLQHRFLVLRKLGQGTYGKVQLALNKETNEEVAVKTIKKAQIEKDEDMLRIRREIHIMASIRHPHIIHINEVFETRQKIVIVMQYASGGELYDYLGCHQALPEDEARRIFRQIASAIYYCHKNHICHRDLKLENILLDEEGNAQIADFGLSNLFDDQRRMNTFCGSPLYASPEIVKGTPYKGPEVDCWSLGVLLYTLVYGTMPFDGRSFKELVSQISEGRYQEPIIRSNASELIRYLLTPEVSRRATITDVCKDNWINEGYSNSLFEIAESMTVEQKLPQRKINASQQCLDIHSKNDHEKSILQKATAETEDKNRKYFSIFSRNCENIPKSSDPNIQGRKDNLSEQITNYDVRCVLNKLLVAVDSSLNIDKSKRNPVNIPIYAQNIQKKEESLSEKVNSDYIIPIFEVASVIPNEHTERYHKVEAQKKVKTPSKIGIEHSRKETCFQPNVKTPGNITTLQSSENDNGYDFSNKSYILTKGLSQNQILLIDSQKQFNNLAISGKPDMHNYKSQNQNYRLQDRFANRHLSTKMKRMNEEDFSVAEKLPNPFMRTKHHVLNLARILALNYEKLKRNSFRMPACKKKPPGKLTIPPTFDTNSPLGTMKRPQEEKKELLIFPTVSVSENKEKIQKKIEKIKKAALNKNIIIRSDSKTRMRIEKYIRSQVKRMQDLVSEEQRSIHTSLENLDEQSIRDMSEMYYRAFGSENTDSGIANTEDEEYFCFLCSKPNGAKATASYIDSIVLDSIKKGCLYTSNHLHVPQRKNQKKWNYISNNNNIEFGTLSRCRSEIEIPTDYLSYISPMNCNLNKSTHEKQQLQKKHIGNTNFFLATQPTLKSFDCNLRLLRSASDSVGLHLNGALEVIKLNTDGQNDALQNCNGIPHFLDSTSSSKWCETFQVNDSYKTQLTGKDMAYTTSTENSLMFEKDDGIGDSNDSFQSYMETFENNTKSTSDISRSKSSHNYMGFIPENTSHNNCLPKRLSSEPYLSYSDKDKNFQISHERGETKEMSITANSNCILQNDEHAFYQQDNKTRGLRRQNTITCVQGENVSDGRLKLDQTSTEFENYLWNVYKENLLESTQNDYEFSSSPNMNYYSLDRKANLKNRDYLSVDNKGKASNNFASEDFLHFFRNSDQTLNEPISPNLKTVLKNSTSSKSQSEHYTGSINRNKSTAAVLSESEQESIIQRFERKLSQGSNAYDSNNTKTTFLSHFLKNLENNEKGRKGVTESNRRRILKTNLPRTKATKSEYKKSFLQLLALKRIQEAEKELDKTPKRDLPEAEEENSGSLLEALKTHGYKSVISQRIQEPDDDYLDPFHTKYLKFPRNLRAELAQLNNMYYESLQRYTLEPSAENDYCYDDLDHTVSMLNGYTIPPFYSTQKDVQKKPQTKFVYDWLNTTQTDDYLNSIRSDAFYTSDQTTTSGARNFCTEWGRENRLSFDGECPSESQDTFQQNIPNSMVNNASKNKDTSSPKPTCHSQTENSQDYSTDDGGHESVQDRIWRKSFYSRFNNRALSRKEKSRSTIFDTDALSESRLEVLNNIYNPPKSGFQRSDISQWDGSSKPFKSKKLKKHSTSFDKYDSNRRRYTSYSKERDFVTSHSDDENIRNNEEPGSEH